MNPADVVNVIIPGWGCCPEGFAPLMKEMEEFSGKRPIYIELDRWTRFVRPNDPRYPSTLRHQALHVIAILDGLGLTQVRLHGFSMDGAIALIVADLRPDLVIKTVPGEHLTFGVVLYNSAGIYLSSPRALARRSWKKLKEDRHDARTHPSKTRREIIEAGGKGFWRYVANPVRSLREGWQMATFPALRQLAPRLARQNILVFSLHGKRDILFPGKEAAVFARNVLGHRHGHLTRRVWVLTDFPHDLQYVPHVLAEQLHLLRLL